MSVLEVRRVGDVFNVILHDGRSLPIQLNEGPVRSFNAGWNPVCVIDGFAPLHMLSLRHDDGSEATWILNDVMLRLAGSLSQLPPEHQAPLQQRAISLFQAVFDRIVKAPRPRQASDGEDLASLCEPTINELLPLAAPALTAGLVTINLNDAAADGVLQPFGLSATDLRDTLAGSVPEAYRQRLRTGELICTSPFDGRPVAAEIGLVLLDRLTAYRFTDPDGQRSFYVMVQDYHEAKTALYLPDAGLYCTAGHAPEASNLVAILAGHAALHQRRLIRYLATPATGKTPINFVSDYPTLHIGHVVWNELSGLEELVELLDPAELPPVCVLNAPNGSEPYGPIDQLYPEFAGRVLRPEVSWSQTAAYVYDNGYFFMRYMTKFVRAAVGRRIRAAVSRDQRLVQERALAQRWREQGRVLVMLGLRVGNRTFGDQPGFLIAAIEHLIDRLGRVVIVIDGHNSRLGLDATTSYMSFGPAGQDDPLIEEMRIVLALRRRYERDRRVEIVGTVGVPLACGLFWGMQSRFFIAPWGAALAKYRWVCNMPGFVLTNRYNLSQNLGDLPIYHDPAYVEAPNPMHFIAPEHVADAPGPTGFYANFTPDPNAVRAGIDQLIAETTPVPQPA